MQEATRTVYIIVVYTGLVWNDGPPQIHVSIILHPPPPPPSFSQQSAAVRFRQSEWRKKLLLLRRSSRGCVETIVPTRKYVLSSLLLIVSTVSFPPLLAKVDVVSRFIPFIADNFVRLASPATVFPNGRSSIRRLPYEKRRGNDCSFFCLPSSLRSKTLKSIDRIANEVELFLHPRGAISRNFTIAVHLLVVASWFRPMPFDCFSHC